MSTLTQRLPITPTTMALGEGPVGLVIVDAVVGFTREGALADPQRMIPMVGRISNHWRELKRALGPRLHTLCFLDAHPRDIPEPPYPPHCIIGTGEENWTPNSAGCSMSLK